MVARMVRTCKCMKRPWSLLVTFLIHACICIQVDQAACQHSLHTGAWSMNSWNSKKKTGCIETCWHAQVTWPKGYGIYTWGRICLNGLVRCSLLHHEGHSLHQSIRSAWYQRHLLLFLPKIRKCQPRNLLGWFHGLFLQKAATLALTAAEADVQPSARWFSAWFFHTAYGMVAVSITSRTVWPRRSCFFNCLCVRSKWIHQNGRGTYYSAGERILQAHPK